MKKFVYKEVYQPLQWGDGDECYPNGCFQFNITKLLAYINDYQALLLLGKSHEKRKAYLEAMSCFAQVFKFAQQQKDPETQREAHLSASEFLRSVIQNLFLIESFEAFAANQDAPRFDSRRLPQKQIYTCRPTPAGNTIGLF